jgi:hypothetical protein
MLCLSGCEGVALDASSSKLATGANASGAGSGTAVSTLDAGTTATGGGTTPTGGGATGTGGGTAGTGGGTTPTGGGTAGTGGGTAGTGGGTAGNSALPAGWLFTQGNKVHVSDGAGAGPVWVGRGVNIDDLFLCGHNSGLTVPDAEGLLTSIVGNLMRDWKPTFLRVSLGLNSYTPVTWTSNPAQYATPMTNVIKSIGAFPGAYVLVTLRTDTSMTRLCTLSSDATCLPATLTASDDLYRAMVDTFATSQHVLFGVTNEPGGMSATDADLRAVMTHAITVIRAEEDRLGTPHHVVSVQGNNWTSRLGFYDAAPLPFDGVVYEYHSYPPEATGTYGYTWSNLPVIIGEYGPASGSSLTGSTIDAFHADVEAKQIPNLAWDVSPFSNCAPDLVAVTNSTTLTPNAWGTSVQNYLLAH